MGCFTGKLRSSDSDNFGDLAKRKIFSFSITQALPLSGIGLLGIT